MKHIVFVIGHYKNGGVAMRTTNLANEFGRRGYSVTILVTKEIGAEVFFELHENVELVLLSHFADQSRSKREVVLDRTKRNKKILFYKRLRYITRLFQSLDKLLEQKIRGIRLSEKLRAYVLLNQYAVFIPFGLAYYEAVFYASEGLTCQILYAEKNAPEIEIPKDEVRAKQLLKIISKSNGAIFQTKDEQEFYSEYVQKNVAVIHNPIKPELPEAYYGERKPIIVNFCRVAKQKNLHLLIDAFIQLHKEYPKYKLEIYGNAVEKSEELLCEELKHYIISKHVEECIYILPPSPEVHKKVRESAMFVSSSDFEGLSNSMIEAMAIGMPCVCTDCLGGGAREVIENEVNGLLVPMNDVNALYNGMKRMIEDKELAINCGRNAARMRNEQSVEKIADKWLEIIECM